jgi:hypothetical protein
MRQRSLGRGELDHAEHEGGHGGKGVQRNARRRVQQRRKIHRKADDKDHDKRP